VKPAIARVIAANNIINALAMTVAAVGRLRCSPVA
jgi:hypothetical protein